MYKSFFLCVFLVGWFGVVHAQTGNAHDIYGARNPGPVEAHLDQSARLAEEPAVVKRSGLYTLLTQGFADIASLPSGWVQQNNSDPLGIIDWFQGNTSVFTAYDGPDNAYIAANFNSTSEAGTISNWLITPVVQIVNGNEFSFWTRTPAGSTTPDRLQLRMSVSGSSTDVGATASSVGDFATLLLDINETYTIGNYPDTWTQYSVVVSGVPEPVQGRFAFRYFVENGGSTGTNSNYVGIDRVHYVTANSLVPLSSWSVILSLSVIAVFSLLLVRKMV